MKEVEEPIFDVVLIGGGIMSATLGVFLKELNPNCSIEIYERLSAVALESSNAWNNAGTGHSGLCELNYTPEKEDGTIDREKFSLKHIIKHLSDLLGKEVKFANDCIDEDSQAMSASLQPGEILLLENTRFYKEEEKGDTRINLERTNEALATGADVIAAACPFCNTMMTDGVKNSNKEDEVKVLDIAEIVAASI